MTLNDSHPIMKALLLAVLFSVPMISAQAADVADDIQYRKMLMKLMEKQQSALSQAVQQNLPLKGQMIIHAQALHGMAQLFGELFPKGSGKSIKGAYRTRAKPNIWTERDTFDAYLLDLQGYTANLVEAAERNDTEAIKSINKNMEELCKSCHKEFRNKQKDVIYQ